MKLNIYLRSFNRYGSLFQNFYNRQKVCYIFASGHFFIFSYLSPNPYPLIPFQRCRIKILSQTSMSATIGTESTMNNLTKGITLYAKM